MKEPIYYRRFDYARTLLPNAHLRTLEEGVSTIDDAEKKSGWTIGYPGWNLIYYALLSHLSWDHPNTIVETGTNQGVSTIVLAQAIRDAKVDGHVHSIEIDPAFAKIAGDNLQKAGLSDLVTQHVGDSVEVLKSLLSDLPSVRVAFLDGAHEHDHVLLEFEQVLSKLEPAGMVIMDNTYALTDPSIGEPARVHEALKTIRKRHGGNIVNFETVSWYTPGLAIWQR